jgi:hypothetical protein
MSLTIPDPPAAAVAAVRSALEPPAAPLTLGVASVRTSDLDQPSQLALAVYGLRATELVAGLVDTVSLIAWQHIVRHTQSGRRATAETIAVNETTHVVGRVTDEPPFLTQTLAAVSDAENIADDGDYEVRLMIVPAVYALAIWLMNSVDRAADKFIVVDAGEIFPAGTRLDARTWYGGLRTEARRIQP